MPEAINGGRSAPRFSVPPTEIVAVEHPMLIKNVDNALKTFGRGLPFEQVLNHPNSIYICFANSPVDDESCSC